MMNCTVRLHWNGALVMEGKATTVCAYDIARAHIASNFAGPELGKYLERHASLGALYDHGSMALEYGGPNDGGMAHAYVERVQA